MWRGHASGASEKFAEVMPSRTSENTFLECKTIITFICFEMKQVSVLESF